MSLSRTIRAWTRLLLPVGLVAAAAAVKAMLLPSLHETPYVIFFPAIIISALYGGGWPGLLAIALSAIAASTWFGPGISVRFDMPGNSAGMYVFLAASVITVGVCRQLLLSRQRLAAEAERLRRSERELAAEVAVRKQAEESLRESLADRNRSQAVAQTGSWRLDVRRNELIWSDETYRIFGIPTETPLTYEKFLAAVHPDDREFVDKSWQAALRGEPYDIEHRIIVGGGVRWVRERAVLDFDAQGVLVGGFGTAQDITERKELEKQKADFFAMITHDLKSPLSVIAGYCDLLMSNGNVAGEQREFVSGIRRSGERLRHLVEDFLTVSQLESGSVRLRGVMVDLKKLMDEAHAEFSILAREKGLTLIDATGGVSPTALLDRGLVERAARNLLQNAINYTPSGGTVTMRAGCMPDESRCDFVAVSVTDTGPGLSPEEIGRIFEKYYRSPKTSVVRGTGLGLSVVKAVAEAHGGRVEVESEEGKGSTFKLILPASPAPE